MDETHKPAVLQLLQARTHRRLLGQHLDLVREPIHPGLITVGKVRRREPRVSTRRGGIVCGRFGA